MAINRSTPISAIGGYKSNGPYTVTVTIPANTLCVVVTTSTNFDDSSNQPISPAVSDTGSHTWTRRANVRSATSYNVVLVDEWFNDTGASVSTTITVDTSLVSYNPMMSVAVQLLQGAKNPSSYTPQVVVQHDISTAQVSLTPGSLGSQVIMAYAQRNGTVAPTPVSGSSLDESPASYYLSSGGFSSGVIARTSVESSTASSITVGASSPTDTTDAFSVAAIEYQDGGGVQVGTATITAPAQTLIASVSDVSAVGTGSGTQAFSWSVSGITGTYASSTSASTTFTPTQAGTGTLTCTINDDSGTYSATHTISVQENHYRIRSTSGEWINPPYAYRTASNSWQPHVHYGIAPTQWPSATNTGYRGALTSYAGPTTVTQANTVIENKHISSRLTIDTTANNVVIRNCLFDAADYYQLIIQGANLLVEDCTFIGQQFTAGSELATTMVSISAVAYTPNGTFSMVRCDISGSEDGITFADNCKLSDSYIHDLGQQAGSHNDAINVDGHIGVEIVHNTILNQYNQTSCATLGDATAGHTPLNSEVLFKNNKIAGGGYSIYGAAAASGSAGIRVIDNVFTTQYFADSGYYGPVTNWVNDGTNVWSGNTWFDGPNAGQAVTL